MLSLHTISFIRGQEDVAVGQSLYVVSAFEKIVQLVVRAETVL